MKKIFFANCLRIVWVPGTKKRKALVLFFELSIRINAIHVKTVMRNSRFVVLFRELAGGGS